MVIVEERAESARIPPFPFFFSPFPPFLSLYSFTHFYIARLTVAAPDWGGGGE